MKKSSNKIICPDGETYTFIGGKAKIPGMKYRGKSIYITRHEFNQLIKESARD